MNKRYYPKITDALVSDGYIVLENALDEVMCKKLLKSAQDETFFKKAGISSSDSLHVDETKRRDKTRWLDEDSAIMSEYLGFSEGLREYLNRTLYLGLTYYEAHFAIYEKNDFYEKHLDAFRGSKNRVVTTVFYLNEEWDEENGGALIIYDENDKLVKKVLPKMGTLVVFLSDKFPHEVLPTNKKRYSVAGWFRVDR